MQELLKHLPERTRDRIYLAGLTLGVLIGAINIGWLTATGDIPLALAVINAVALFLGVPVATGTARANLTRDITIVEPPDEDREFDNSDSPQFIPEAR